MELLKSAIISLEKIVFLVILFARTNYLGFTSVIGKLI